MEKMLKALEAEIKNLTERHRAECERGQRMIAEALRETAPSTHLGHNLANVANEISELAARIEQTEMIARDMRTRIEFSKESK